MYSVMILIGSPIDARPLVVGRIGLILNVFAAPAGLASKPRYSHA
jgi:hypothetical protein